MRRPIFITGVPRSGTTLMAQIINNHPDINCAYDSVNFMRFWHDDKHESIQDTHDRIQKRWGMSFDIEKVLEQKTKAGIYDTMMKSIFDSEKTWGEKTTMCWNAVPEFLEMFPNGRVIHMIRDPRDVLASWKKFTNAPGNDYLDIVFNCLGSMQRAKLYSKRYPIENYMHVRFEDLVRHPEEMVRGMCYLFDIEYTDEMINPDKFTDKSGDKWTGNSMYKEFKEITPKAIGNYKDKLKEWEVFFAERYTNDMMSEYGYDISMIPSIGTMTKKNMEANKSELVKSGIERYENTGLGIERFPNDPTKEKNWESEKKQLARRHK